MKPGRIEAAPKAFRRLTWLLLTLMLSLAILGSSPLYISTLLKPVTSFLMQDDLESTGPYSLGTGTTSRESGSMYCDSSGVWQNSRGARQNIVAYSEDKDQWNDSKLTITTSTDFPSGVSGISSSYKVVANNENAGHYFYESSATNAGNYDTYIASFYGKAAGYSYVYLTLQNDVFPSSSAAFFNLTTGAVGTLGAGASGANIEAVGNGWYRCSIYAQCTGATPELTSPIVYSGNNTENVTFAGDGTSGFLFAGFQLEKVEGPALGTSVDLITDGTFSEYGLGSTELFTDGSLETWTDANNLTNWTCSGADQETTIVHSGSSSIKLTSPAGASEATFYQVVNVTAGKGYYISGYARVNAGDDADVAVGVRNYPDGSTWTLSHAAEIDGLADDQWVRFGFPFIIPVGITSVRVYFYSSATEGDICYIDSLSMKELSFTEWTGDYWMPEDLETAYNAEDGQIITTPELDAWTYGSDLLGGDGDCATDFMNGDTGDWVYDAVNDWYDIDGSQGGIKYLYMTSLLTYGKTYKMTFDATVAAGTVWVSATNGTASGAVVSATDTDIVRYGVCITNENFYIGCSDDFSGSVDNIVIEEINVPTGWTAHGSFDATHYVGYDPVNNNIDLNVADSNRGLKQTVLTSGDLYYYAIYISSYTSGEIGIYTDGWEVTGLNSTGWHTGTFIAGATTVIVLSSGNTELTIDSVYIWPANTEESTTGGDFDAWTYGSEELDDPTLEDAAEWDSSDGNITHDDGAGTVTWDGLGAGTFSSVDSPLTIGKTYKVEFVVDSIANGAIYLANGGAFAGTDYTEWDSGDGAGTYIEYAVCTADSTINIRGDATCDAVVSNISVKEVNPPTGWEAYNTNDADDYCQYNPDDDSITIKATAGAARGINVDSILTGQEPYLVETYIEVTSGTIYFGTGATHIAVTSANDGWVSLTYIASYHGIYIYNYGNAEATIYSCHVYPVNSTKAKFFNADGGGILTQNIASITEGKAYYGQVTFSDVDDGNASWDVKDGDNSALYDSSGTYQDVVIGGSGTSRIRFICNAAAELSIDAVTLYDATSPGPLTPSPYTATAGSAVDIVVPGAFHHIGGVNVGAWLGQSETNWALYSRDFGADENGMWSLQNNMTAVRDAVGFDGVTNSAVTLNDDSSACEWVKYGDVPITADTEDIGVGVFVEKTIGATVHPVMLFGTGTSSRASIGFNTNTGAVFNHSIVPPDGSIVLDYGDFWYVYFWRTNNNESTMAVGFYPSYSADGDPANYDASLENTLIFDQVDIRRGQDWIGPPIVTSDIPIGRAADDPIAWTMTAAFKALFQAGGQGTAVVELTPMLSQAAQDAAGNTGLLSVQEGDISNVLYFSTTGSGSLVSYDGANAKIVEHTFIAGTTFQGAVKFSTVGMEIAVDGAYSGGLQTYGGAYEVANDFEIFSAGFGSWCFKNIRFYNTPLSKTQIPN